MIIDKLTSSIVLYCTPVYKAVVELYLYIVLTMAVSFSWKALVMPPLVLLLQK